MPFLRQAGLSERKAEYIKGLAERFNTGELTAELLLDASDDEIMEKLTAVRGLGRWSVEVSHLELKKYGSYAFEPGQSTIAPGEGRT